jgi:hypothetical protein
MFGVKESGEICMSVKVKKHVLEQKRRRLRSQGWDLDIVDKVRLQMLREELEREGETGNIYDDKQRGEMLEADTITAAENAFMQGRKKTYKRQNRDLDLDGK